MKPQAYPASLREAEAGSATEVSGDEPRVVDHVDLHAKHTMLFLSLSVHSFSEGGFAGLRHAEVTTATQAGGFF